MPHASCRPAWCSLRNAGCPDSRPYEPRLEPFRSFLYSCSVPPSDSAVATPSAAEIRPPLSPDVLTVFVHADGETRVVETIDPAWLSPDSGVIVWADIGNVDPATTRAILAGTFKFHELSVEDALACSHHPKVEPYDGYLYLILHGIDWNAKQQGGFTTHDIDFFLGPNYLVTVHNGTSRSIASVQGICPRNAFVLGGGPMRLLHRIVDTMVDHYRPRWRRSRTRLDALEEAVFERPHEEAVRQILRSSATSDRCGAW